MNIQYFNNWKQEGGEKVEIVLLSLKIISDYKTYFSISMGLIGFGFVFSFPIKS